MMSFDGPIRLSTTTGKTWTLVTDLRYCDSMTGFRVFAGFTTDLASVPRPLWWLLPPHGRYIRAAVLHDWLYAKHWSGDRKSCDRVFRRAMRADGVNPWQVFAIYHAVRWFGWLAWRRHGAT